MRHLITARKVSKLGVFWSVFSRIWTAYGIYEVIRENTDKKNTVNTGKYKYGKIGTRKTPYLDTFRAVQLGETVQFK